MKKILLLVLFVVATNKMFSVESYTPDQTSEGVKETYKILKWHYPWGMSFYMTTNVLSDDAKSGGTKADDRPEYEAADKFTLTPENAGPQNLWTKYMSGITKANEVLTYSVDNGSDSIKRLLAEAKFLRAYYYFDFVRIFGNVPLITKIEENVNYPQSTKAEVYAQIEKDLLEAIPLLPLKSQLELSENDRATKGAAQFLLGKVYLYQEKWELAKNVLLEVKDSQEYDLFFSYKNIWQGGFEHLIESIFEIPYVDDFSMDWGGHSEGNIDIQLMGIRELGSNDLGLSAGWGFCLPTQELVDAFYAAKDTERLDATVIKEKDLDDLNISYSTPYDKTGYHNNKYAARSVPDQQYMYSQNEIVMRYSEVLLMLAEAEYHLGNTFNAQIYLTMVRERVSLPEVTAEGEDLFKAIQEERRLELALENNRYFDLIRWGKAEEVLTPLGYKKETNGLYPIPAGEMAINSLLIQNPGYTSSAINTVESNSIISLFPNPVINDATLRINNAYTNENVYVTINAIDGRTVKKLFFNNVDSNCNLQVGDLTTGLYTINVQIGNSIKTQLKFIKK